MNDKGRTIESELIEEYQCGLSKENLDIVAVRINSHYFTFPNFEAFDNFATRLAFEAASFADLRDQSEDTRAKTKLKVVQ